MAASGAVAALLEALRQPPEEELEVLELVDLIHGANPTEFPPAAEAVHPWARVPARRLEKGARELQMRLKNALARHGEAALQGEAGTKSSDSLASSPSLSALAEHYEEIVHGNMPVRVLEHVLETLERLQLENSSSLSSFASEARDTAVEQLSRFCANRLLVGQEAIAKGLGGDRTSATLEIMVRKLRLLDLQIQLRLSLMSLRPPASLKGQNSSIKELKKFIQMYGVHSHTMQESFTIDSHSDPTRECRASVSGDVRSSGASFPEIVGLADAAGQGLLSEGHGTIQGYLCVILLPQFRSFLPGVLDRLLDHFEATPEHEATAAQDRGGQGERNASSAPALVKVGLPCAIAKIDSTNSQQGADHAVVNAQTASVGAQMACALGSGTEPSAGAALRRQLSKAGAHALGQVSFKEHHQQKREQLNSLPLVKHPKRSRNRGQIDSKTRGSASNGLSSSANASHMNSRQAILTKSKRHPCGNQAASGRCQKKTITPVKGSPQVTPRLKRRLVLVEETPLHPSARAQLDRANEVLVHESPLLKVPRPFFNGSPSLMLR